MVVVFHISTLRRVVAIGEGGYLLFLDFQRLSRSNSECDTTLLMIAFELLNLASGHSIAMTAPRITIPMLVPVHMSSSIVQETVVVILGSYPSSVALLNRYEVPESSYSLG
jgi:hypothetical protein